MQYQSMEKSKQRVTSNTNHYYDYNSSDSEISTMAKTFSILSYITILGWFAAIVLHGSHKSSFTSFHLRQSLGLIITGALLALIPLIGWVLNVVVLLLWLHAVYHVVQGHKVKVPILGDFYQAHLDFIK
jgi:uncharacterized membrane protein